MMAPFMEEPSTHTPYVSKATTNKDSHRSPSLGKTINLIANELVERNDDYEHDNLRPMFPDVHWEPLTEVPYHDRGMQGKAPFGVFSP